VLYARTYTQLLIHQSLYFQQLAMAPSRSPALEEASDELGSSMAALRLKGSELLDEISEQFEQCEHNM
jgi:hypothetical protein